MSELDFAGKDRDCVPCRVFDATGAEHDAVASCNTETGRIEKYRLDPKTGLLLVEGEHNLTDIVHAPAPLTIGEW